MKKRVIFLLAMLVLSVGVRAQDAAAGAAPAVQADPAMTTTAAAAVASGAAAPRAPDFLEHMVDLALKLFDVKSSGNTTTHYTIAALFLVLSYLLRHVVTTFIFGFFRRMAARTKTTLDDKLFPALEAPVATFVTLVGAVAALKVLKLSPEGDALFGYATTMAFSLNLFWLLLRAFNTVLDHLHAVALERQSSVAAFMPWIKKSLVTIFVIFGGLMIAQSLGADVKAFLAGLGLGGLAFALAAQDTIANLFGSVVVAIDQPFKLGQFVQIGANQGTVEDIGLRSTKLRTPATTLIIIPNKSVAAEVITNFSRMTQRRVEQTITLGYATKIEQMDAVLVDIRAAIAAEPLVDQKTVVVQFANYGIAVLEVLVIYHTVPDLALHNAAKGRINLAIMRAVNGRGLTFR